MVGNSTITAVGSKSFQDMHKESLETLKLDKIFPSFNAIIGEVLSELTSKNPVEQVSPLFMAGLGSFAVANVNRDETFSPSGPTGVSGGHFRA